VGKNYAIIGSGRQGTASAYDLACYGEADLILLADSDEHQAEIAATRINRLLKADLARAVLLDASDVTSVTELLEDHQIDAFVAGTPYSLNLGLTQTAIQTRSGMTDLGGNSDVVHAQLDLNDQAKGAGISIVPDCGLGPGMTTTLALYAMEQLDEALEVFIWDCGLPQKPIPPWNYSLTFSIGGLTNEYYGDCLFIRDGKTTLVPALEELEMLDFPEPIGTLEAFTTSGGITTAATTFAGKLRTLQNKTMRYPGHYDALKVIQRLGLLETELIDFEGREISPREMLHKLWEPQIRAAPDTPDLGIIRILAIGEKDGNPMEAQVQLILYYDDETGFTAMEQGTGWHAAIITAALAHAKVPFGVIPVEKAMSGTDFVDEASKRGFNIELELRPTS